MEVTKTQEMTSADKKSIGFDYQFLYFVYRILDLKKDETIGYEVKDDVHLELNNGHEILIQLKHSLQTTTNNSIINMTERDIDLWKSLYNWNSFINDINENERIKYINNVKFVLVTNKNSIKNPFFVECKKLNDEEINIKKFKEYISSLKYESTDTEYKKKMNKYMESLLNQDDEILNKFIGKINFELGFDDLIKRIKNQILSKFIDEKKLDEIFERCLGNLSIWKYETVKGKGKLIITFEDVNKRLKNCFTYGRSNKRSRNCKAPVLPDKLEEQNFIKELLEIEDIEIDEKVTMAKYTTYRLKIENLINKWIEEGYITETEHDEFVEECNLIWSNVHKEAHRASKKELKKKRLDEDSFKELLTDNAQNCLDSIRKEILKLCDEDLNIEDSNGTFYSLSEQQCLGWKYEWESKY